MAQFKPFDTEGIPIEEQFMNWREIVQAPYDKVTADAYTHNQGYSYEWN